MARGEWSLGKIIDVYFKFGQVGDQYLGRILALLDPNTPEFKVLPPHWIDATDPAIKEGIEVCFPKLTEAHGNTAHDPTGLSLSIFLAQLVYHSDWLLQMSALHKGHQFGSIPIIDNHILLKKLKENVTLEPSPSCCKPSGHPTACISCGSATPNT